MLSSIVLGLALVSGHGSVAEDSRLYGFGPYTDSVKRPESVLGYELGSRHTVLMDQERVVQSIVGSTNRAKYLSYGQSKEGRPLRAVAFSSPENIARLDEIQGNLQKIAHAKKGENLKELEAKTPALVWINECIHGDETASFESAMALMFNLAASTDPKVTEALKKVVVMVNPCYNPDGHERYVVAYNSIPNGNGKDGSYDRAIPSPFFGRANHYRFDMNRDRVAMSQAETRQEVSFLLSWNPQVYADQHGQVENYFFPPVQQSINVNVDRDRYIKWTEIFGRATASAFDREGWSYFVRDSFDFYAPCYLDSFTALTGAIGMTHETSGGRVLNSEDRDGFVVTLTEGIEKHFTSAMAVILSAAENRDQLMSDFVDYKVKATSGELAGKFQRVVVQGDRRDLRRLADQLGRMGVKSSYTEAKFEQKSTHDYWSDGVGKREFNGPSLVIDMAQSLGALAKAMLEPGSDFEPEFIERQKKLAAARRSGEAFDEIDSYEFYDLTGWSLPYAYGLDAWWCEDVPAVESAATGDAASAVSGIVVGYSLDYSDREDLTDVFAAMQAGYRVSLVRKENVLNGSRLAPGTFIVMKARNPEAEISRFENTRWKPILTSYPEEGRQGPGSESVQRLRKPEIGIVFGEAGNLSGGSLWFLMENEFKLPFRSLTTDGVASALSGLTCLVVPDGVSLPMDEKLKSWVADGGSLVLLGGGQWAMGEEGFFDLGSVRCSEGLPGTLFRADVDEHSVLSYGYPRGADGQVKLAVPVGGSRFRKGTENSVLKVAPNGLLSGWAWDDSEQVLTGTSWCESVDYGRGRVTWFADDPTDRAQWPGLWKMMLNAMILGPG